MSNCVKGHIHDDQGYYRGICGLCKGSGCMTKQNCYGCVDDFYSHRTGFDGATECWSFKTAKLIQRKKVSIHQTPPWTQSPSEFPSCYHCKGYVFVNGDRIR